MLRAHKDRQGFERQFLGEGYTDDGLICAIQLGTAFLAAATS